MNEDIIKQIALELNIRVEQVKSTLKMLEDGNTIPFIARYRKEVTGNLDEEQIRLISEVYEYQVNLLKRKEDVIRLIDEKGLLTDKIKTEVMNASKLVEVEDLYRPYKEKKKTKATEAIKNGLEGLAKIILSFPKELYTVDKFLNDNVKTKEDAIEGAKYIIAEYISDNAYYRKWIRSFLYKNASLTSKKKKNKKVQVQKRAAAGESIENRPDEVATRETFGHWEMDTVYSSKEGSCALLVMTERLTRKEIIEKMRDRTAISTVRALNRIERRFGTLFPRVFQTITVDNGGEFSDVKSLERSILRKGRRTKMYYCHPYTSCERGSNECANKMVRRKFPKGTDFNKVSRAEVKKAEEWMNNYPREILGWKTAEIVFAECLEELAREA